MNAYPEPTCTKCGCTNNNPCEGGCWWVEQNVGANTGVCSKCNPELAAEAEKIVRAFAEILTDDLAGAMNSPAAAAVGLAFADMFGEAEKQDLGADSFFSAGVMLGIYLTEKGYSNLTKKIILPI